MRRELCLLCILSIIYINDDFYHITSKEISLYKLNRAIEIAKNKIADEQ
jgi:hypothetical protein